LVWARYTLEFKQEAVRLVRGGQTVSSVAKTLGLSDQALLNPTSPTERDICDFRGV
jgi:transposase